MQDDLTPNLPAELPDSTPIDLWDRTNERSVINIVPPAIGQSIFEAAKAKPEFFEIEDERTLRKTLRADNREPSPTDNRLRVAFWNEYERAQGSDRPKMNMSAIYNGVCSRQLFERYMTRPEKVAWLLCPPASYTTIAEEALSFGLEQLRDILALPVKNEFGKVDVKLGELQAKIVAMLDNRVKGAVKQTVENRNMNLNISTSDKSVAKAAMSGTMDQIERRLKELEKRDKSRVPVEVTATEVTDDSSEAEAD